MRTVIKVSSLILLLFAATSSAKALASNLENSDVLEAFVDGYVGPAMGMQRSASGVVAIAHKGRLIYSRGYGFQDIDKRVPVEAGRTLFKIGSVSKLFTWIAVMQQVEKGNLDLDTDINRYLKRVEIKDTWPDRPITLRHIMTHTSGFEDGGLGYLIVRDSDKVSPLSESMSKYQPYRVNPPGVQTAYSNYATALAGLIVEDVTGIPFDQYVQESIFGRLGLRRTSFQEPLPPSLKDDMATGYLDEKGGYEAKPYEFIGNFYPAGSVSATAKDMIAFAQSILDSGNRNSNRLLEKATLDSMLSRQFSHDERVPGMGLGFYETEENGFLLYGHGGDTTIFHSELVVDRVNDLAIFVSFTGSGGSIVRSNFKSAFYDQFFPANEEAPVPPSDFSTRADKYVGTYHYWRSNFSTFEKVVGLRNRVSVSRVDDNYLLVDSGRYLDKFVEVESNLFKLADPNRRGYSPKIAFQENSDGEITGFVAEGLPFMSTYKSSIYQSGKANFLLLVLAIIVFISVCLRYFYQKASIQALSAGSRSAYAASLYVSLVNIFVFLSGVLILSASSSEIIFSVPTILKVWMILPLFTFAAGLYLAFKAVEVWRLGLLEGVCARVRYSFVLCAALFMCWFYWYWNLFGMQYLV